MMKPLAGTMVAAALLAALMLVPASLAGQPVTQTLNPPPPPFETCKTVGNGTICQGTIDSSYGPFDTGLVCGSGADAFGIADSATQQELARRDYDADGNLVKRYINDRLQGQLSNEVSGATVPYTQTRIQTDVLAVPGDRSSATTTLTGELVLKPATGPPIVIGAGKDVFAPDGSLDFQAGPSGFLDLLAGDPSVVEPTCAALGAA
jgi:hypothetical protein